jgi:hypothetical protein
MKIFKENLKEVNCLRTSCTTQFYQSLISKISNFSKKEATELIHKLKREILYSNKEIMKKIKFCQICSNIGSANIPNFEIAFDICFDKISYFIDNNDNFSKLSNEIKLYLKSLSNISHKKTNKLYIIPIAQSFKLTENKTINQIISIN